MKKHLLFLIAICLTATTFSQGRYIDTLIRKYGVWTYHYNKTYVDSILATYQQKTSAGAISLPSTATDGIRVYNTVDQTTNTEYLQESWNANTYEIATKKSGTGSDRNLSFYAASAALNIRASQGITGAVNVNRNLTTGGTTLLSGSTTVSNTTGNVNIFYPIPTINQSGSAGYRAVGTTVYEQSVGSGPRLLLALSTNTAANGGGTLTEKFTVDYLGKPTLWATNTAGGTTGNQTINRPSGTVNIAAAGTTVTVTNSTCTTSSIVLAVLRTADATAWLKNVVPGSGSFVVTLGAAATAEVSIGFVVIN